MASGSVHFNPRSPHGERHFFAISFLLYCRISIHAPRTGSDRTKRRKKHCSTDFNPRSPHGERHKLQVAFTNTHIFQSTLPARGATYVDADGNIRKRISIHAPRTGSDRMRPMLLLFSVDFNPRSPHGERLAVKVKEVHAGTISIHAPRTGSDDGAPNVRPDLL